MTREVITDNRLAIELMEDHPNASVEDFIDAIEVMIERDKEGYIQEQIKRGGIDLARDPVLACLDGALEHLRDAGMAMYASFK